MHYIFVGRNKKDKRNMSKSKIREAGCGSLLQESHQAVVVLLPVASRGQDFLADRVAETHRTGQLSWYFQLVFTRLTHSLVWDPVAWGRTCKLSTDASRDAWGNRKYGV